MMEVSGRDFWWEDIHVCRITHLISLALAGTDVLLPSFSRRDEGSRRDNWRAERKPQQVHDESPSVDEHCGYLSCRGL